MTIHKTSLEVRLPLEGIPVAGRKTKEMAGRKTSPKVARSSSRVLRNVGTRRDAKSAAGSALSQAATKAKPSRSTRKK